MPSLFQFRSYVTYWLDAVDEHSLHSPFFYDFYTRVVRVSPDAAKYRPIETLRSQLLTMNKIITVDDLGAGPATSQGATRKVKDIARTSLSTPEFSSLYARIIQHFNCKNILELGTSLGINALYLASASGAGQVTTFEGASELAEMARTTFEFHPGSNITLQEGNINKTLPAFLRQAGKIDFAFVDANHRYEPTRQYADWLFARVHERSILVFDDIHYSAEMEKAWKELKRHTLVYGSADLYRCGILFFDPSLNKQHVVLQF
jgi:hypothetical protein